MLEILRLLKKDGSCNILPSELMDFNVAGSGICENVCSNCNCNCNCSSTKK